MNVESRSCFFFTFLLLSLLFFRWKRWIWEEQFRRATISATSPSRKVWMERAWPSPTEVSNSSSFKSAFLDQHSGNQKTMIISNDLRYQVNYPVIRWHRWEFYCEEGDIDFAIYLKNDSGNSTVVPKDRVDCHIAPEAGEIRADPGQCNIHFRQWISQSVVWLIKSDFSDFRCCGVWQ